MKLFSWRESPSVKQTLNVLTYVSSILLAAGITYLVLLINSRHLSPLYYFDALKGLNENYDSIMSTLKLGSLLFGFGLWILVLVVVLRWPLLEAFGWILLVVGGGIYFTAPTLLIHFVPDIDFTRVDSPGHQLLSFLRLHSGGMLCLGALRVALGMILRRTLDTELMSMEMETATTVDKSAPHSVCRYCWELPSCRKAIRKDCPRFRQRVACWRTKKGCYCNMEVAKTLLEATHSAKLQDEAQRTSRPGMKARQTAALISVSKAAAQERKPTCIQCNIYQEHQRYKARVISWIVFPGAAVLTWFLSGYLRDFWFKMDRVIGNLMGQVSVLPTKATPGVAVADYGQALDFSWVMVIVIGLILVSVVMKGVEYLLFKLGL